MSIGSRLARILRHELSWWFQRFLTKRVLKSIVSPSKIPARDMPSGPRDGHRDHTQIRQRYKRMMSYTCRLKEGPTRWPANHQQIFLQRPSRLSITLLQF